MERQRIAAEARQSELTDRILSMKGYREFTTVLPSGIIPDPEPEWEEKSEYENEGFRPY